jgi:hypothetical protein
MSLSTKILIWLAVILGLTGLGFIVYQQHEISAKQAAIESQIVEQKQLVDGIVRSQSTWTTREDMDKFIKDNGVNLKAIQDDLDKLHGEINAVNVVMASSQGQHGNNLPSTGTGSTNPNPTPSANDPYGYLSKEQKLAVNEDFGSIKIPFGTVGFSAWQAAPWSIDIKPREYNVATTVGIDENQRNYFYNRFTVKVDGKEYEVPIKTATTKQVIPEAKFSWWNPMVFLTAGGSVNTTGTPEWGDFNIGATFGFMSWGRYKTTPTLSIMQVGLGANVIDQQPAVIINPINFNLGTVIPFIHNTYIGPSVQMGFPQFKLMVGGNLSLAL